MKYDFLQFTTPWEEQKFLNMTDDEYHQRTIAMSSGKLKELLKTPAHFLSSLTVPRKETPALRFGSIAHMAILEGPRFLEKYKVTPVFMGKTKDGRDSAQSGEAKAKKAQWLLDQPKGTIILEDQAELDQITGMLTAIMDHPTASFLIRQGKPEVAGLFNHQGIRGKLKADILIEEHSIIADVKTCIDAAETPFTKAAWNNKYMIQAAWYLLGASIITGRKWDSFSYIAVEKTPPYAVAVHTCDVAYLTGGERMMEVALGRFKRCIEKGEWPGYPTAASVLTLPSYAMYEIESLERSYQMESTLNA
jgi:hypothetical protein